MCIFINVIFFKFCQRGWLRLSSLCSYKHMGLNCSVQCCPKVIHVPDSVNVSCSLVWSKCVLSYQLDVYIPIISLIFVQNQLIYVECSLIGKFPVIVQGDMENTWHILTNIRNSLLSWLVDIYSQPDCKVLRWQNNIIIIIIIV